MVGIPFVVVTSYLLYRRGISFMTLIHLPCADKASVVLGQEQKPLEAPPEGPLVAKHG